MGVIDPRVNDFEVAEVYFGRKQDQLHDEALFLRGIDDLVIGKIFQFEANIAEDVVFSIADGDDVIAVVENSKWHNGILTHTTVGFVEWGLDKDKLKVVLFFHFWYFINVAYGNEHLFGNFEVGL